MAARRYSEKAHLDPHSLGASDARVTAEEYAALQHDVRRFLEGLKKDILAVERQVRGDEGDGALMDRKTRLTEAFFSGVNTATAVDRRAEEIGVGVPDTPRVRLKSKTEPT